MSVFVLGASHTGKTPFARLLAARLGVPVVRASQWVRDAFPPLPESATTAERAAYVDTMTAWSREQLRAAPDVSAVALRTRIAAAGGRCVVEGVRNPYDFVHAFDPRGDLAVTLRYTGADALAPTAFEQGLGVIDAYLAWLADNQLLAHPPRAIVLARFADLEAEVAALAVPDAAPAIPRVHAAIPPLPTHVRAEYLYGMDPARVGELRACTAISVSSYLGNAPTFQILLGDGALFSYVPPSALIDPQRREDPQLELADLVYHDCKSTEIVVQVLDALRGPVRAYFKRVDRWLAGDYLFTIDWYAGNDMLHALALANGQYALLPSHKVKFGDHPPGFEPYKKIRREWHAS